MIISILIDINLLPAQVVEPKFEKIQGLDAQYCILEDSFGFIWVGTQTGLFKYDGYNYKHYAQKPFDTTSISNNWVTSLEEDKKGNLWVGTWGSGLDYFNQKTEKFTHYTGNKNKSVDLTNSNISSIIINDDGSLWVGTQDQGLVYINFDNKGTAGYKRYNLSNNTETDHKSWDNSVLTLFKDHNGKLWVGTREKGLKYFESDSDKIKGFNYEPKNHDNISSNTVSSICEDTAGNLWIGTGYWMTPNGKGLNKFDPKTKKFIHFEHNPKDSSSLSSNNISSLLIDKEGTLWIGTVDNRLNSIPIAELISNLKPHFTYYANSAGNAVNSIYEDKVGNIWIASFGGGVHKIQKHNPFTRYSLTKTGSNLSSILDLFMIYEDKSRKIWFGFVSQGLYYYKREISQFTQYKKLPIRHSDLFSNFISGMCEDNKGFYWFATHSTGLFRLNPKTGTFYHYSANNDDKFTLTSNIISKVSVSRSGNIFVLTQKSGLQIFDMEENRFYHFDLDSNSTADEEIYGFCEDHFGKLWIGTWNYGLYEVKIKDHRITHLEHFKHNPNDLNSISNNLVSSIVCPQIIDTSAVWIATANGLNRFDLNTRTITHFFTEDGLPDNGITNILEDNEGNIWSACLHDIAVYNIKTKEIQSYGIDDGLPFSSFSSRLENSCKTSDGQLIFGSNYEAVGFYPEQLKNNFYVPPVYITDFSIFQKSVELDTTIQFKKNLILSYSQNAFSLKFTALNFTNPGKNQYAYKMEGFHDDWIYIGNQRTASFTNLDPGKYTFRVKGSNNHGVWNEEGTSISIIILPPWWATWWFRSIAVIFLAASVYSIYKYRINRLLEMERMRVQIATDLHDDVGASLTKIAVHSEIIQSTEDRKKITSSSVKIGNISREIITSLSDIIWSIDARNDKVEDLIDRMREYLDTVFPPGKISTDFQTHGLVFDNNIDQVLRQNIYLIFKEAVNNAAKHSEAAKINIHLANGDGKFKLEISDNGKGIELNEKGSGYHGLQNMKLRAERIGGKLQIENNNGTNVILTLKEL